MTLTHSQLGGGSPIVTSDDVPGVYWGSAVIIDPTTGLPITNFGVGTVPALSVSNAIEITGVAAHDLTAPFTATSSIDTDFELDNVTMQFSTAGAKDFRILSADGAVLVSRTTNTDQDIAIMRIGIAFNGSDNFTIEVDNGVAGCEVQVVARVRNTGVTSAVATFSVLKPVNVAAWDLVGSGDLSAVSAITGDYVLDHVLLQFTTTASKDIRLLSADGATLIEVIGDTSVDFALTAVDLGFDAGDNFTLEVENASGACSVDAVVRAYQGVASCSLQSVVNAIDRTLYDLRDVGSGGSGALSLSSNISVPYVLDSIEINRTSTAASDVTITSPDGTILLYLAASALTDISTGPIDMVFQAGENFTIAMTDTVAVACDVDVIARIRQS